MTSTPTLDLPVVALTMGDAAGIGPEVIVPAVLDERVAAWCRPVVIGDVARLRSAAEILGVACDVVVVADGIDLIAEPAHQAHPAGR